MGSQLWLLKYPVIYLTEFDTYLPHLQSRCTTRRVTATHSCALRPQGSQIKETQSGRKKREKEKRKKKWKRELRPEMPVSRPSEAFTVNVKRTDPSKTFAIHTAWSGKPVTAFRACFGFSKLHEWSFGKATAEWHCCDQINRKREVQQLDTPHVFVETQTLYQSRPKYACKHRVWATKINGGERRWC